MALTGNPARVCLGTYVFLSMFYPCFNTVGAKVWAASRERLDDMQRERTHEGPCPPDRTTGMIDDWKLLFLSLLYATASFLSHMQATSMSLLRSGIVIKTIFPHNWVYGVLKSLVSHCIHTQHKETQGLKLLKHHSLPSICKGTTITRNEWRNQNGTKVCTAAEKIFTICFILQWHKLPLVTCLSRRYLLCFCAVDKDAFYQFSEVCRTHHSCCQLPPSPFSKQWNPSGTNVNILIC